MNDVVEELVEKTYKELSQAQKPQEKSRRQVPRLVIPDLIGDLYQ